MGHYVLAERHGAISPANQGDRTRSAREAYGEGVNNRVRGKSIQGCKTWLKLTGKGSTRRGAGGEERASRGREGRAYPAVACERCRGGRVVFLNKGERNSGMEPFLRAGEPRIVGVGELMMGGGTGEPRATGEAWA